MTLPSAFGSQIILSWSVVRQVAQVFSLLTTTVSASLATTISWYSTLFSSQIFASSSSMGRDASFMSVSPAQNDSKPPPVPDSPTVIWTSGLVSLKSSAATLDIGPTVLEPSMATVPVSRAVVRRRCRRCCRPRRRSGPVPGPRPRQPGRSPGA